MFVQLFSHQKCSDVTSWKMILGPSTSFNKPLQFRKHYILRVLLWVLFFFFFENCCWHLLDTGMLQKITTEESETDSSGKAPFFSNVKHFE